MRIIQSQWLGFFLSVSWLICSLHTGWSASNSEPYIRTRFAHLSKSEIFFGNQGTSHISERRRESMSCLLRMQFTFILAYTVPAGFALPSSVRQELSGGSISTTFTCFRSSWMISFNCSWLLSQSTKISNSELRLLDFLDSMCTRLTWFSWNRHYKLMRMVHEFIIDTYIEYLGLNCTL